MPRLLLKTGANLLAKALICRHAPRVLKCSEGGCSYAPGKAANAGGVATSGLEIGAELYARFWTAKEVDDRLKEIMKAIHDNAYAASAEFGRKGDYVTVANIAALLKCGFYDLHRALVEQNNTQLY